MPALAVLTCDPKAFTFQERLLYKKHMPAKIGTSEPGDLECISDGLFNCKALAADHALLWYDDKADKVSFPQQV